VCDPFGGIGVLGAYLKHRGYAVTSGDLLTFAHYFQIARLELSRSPNLHKLRIELGVGSVHELFSQMSLPRHTGGWLVDNYAVRRKFFTLANAGMIQACWDAIAQWNRNGWLTRRQRAFMYASLVASMDRVANTAGTYYAHLKRWDRKAVTQFQLRPVIPTQGSQRCKSVLGNAEDIVSQGSFDVVYLDPPYTARPYNRYYHLPESIVVGRTGPVLGAAGLPATGVGVDSDFSRARTALRATEKLLAKVDCRLLVFHYAHGGLVPLRTLRSLLGELGKVQEHRLNVRAYATSRSDHRTAQVLLNVRVDHSRRLRR